VQLAESDCNGNNVPDACEIITGGHFDADGDLDLLDFAGFQRALLGN
jgi:hypothetical protein